MALDMIGGGLIYFPLAINFWENDKIKAMENKFQEIGVYRWLKLLGNRIYKVNGYYTKWSEVDAKLYSEANNCDLLFINALIDFCLEYDILSKEIYYTYGVLTGRGIQEVYLNANKKNRIRTVTMIWEYCVLAPEEYGDLKNTTIKLTNINKENLDKSKLPTKKLISTPPEKRPSQEEIDKAISEFTSPCSTVETETPTSTAPKPKFTDQEVSNSSEFKFDQAMIFANRDFNSENELFQRLIISQPWLSAYKKFLCYIDEKFDNLKSCKFQVTFKEFKELHDKWKFGEDEITEVLRKLSKKGVEPGGKLAISVDQYLFYVRQNNSTATKQTSTPLYPMLFDARVQKQSE